MSKEIMIKLGLVVIIVLVISIVSINGDNEYNIIHNRMRIDSNDRLLDNWLVHSNNDKCNELVKDVFNSRSYLYRDFMAADEKIEQEIFQDNPNGCSISCIDIGMHKDYIYYPLPKYIYTVWKENESIDNSNKQLSLNVSEWIFETCQRVELKVALIGHDSGKLWWINPNGDAVFNGHLQEGEKSAYSLTTTIGHKFAVTDDDDNIIIEFVIKYNSFIVAGSDGSKTRYRNVTSEVYQTFESEFQRHDDVKRTFTELGFAKGRLPNDLWASISAFYYNNRNNKAIEAWYKKQGIYVNWWESDVYMILFPWDLSKYWQARLKLLVEKWVGLDLELTDIYGMRQYEENARLLTHVDRTQTHAVSLIINVAQKDIRVPWAVEIYDHANRLHEVIMDEGDIVYYESAKCLHGRMKPLQGAFYVNMFAHYRPTDDPDWFTKENPPDAPKPLIDIGECEIVNNGLSPPKCSGDHNLPFLSPKLYKLQTGADLFDYWNEVGEDTSLNPPADIDEFDEIDDIVFGLDEDDDDQDHEYDYEYEYTEIADDNDEIRSEL